MASGLRLNFIQGKKSRFVAMNILVVQRQSLVTDIDFSLSVYARIIEAMDWLRDQGVVNYATCGEYEEEMKHCLGWADALIFCKHSSERSLKIMQRATEMGLPTILDLDDWVFEFPSYSGGTTGQTQRVERIRAMMTMASMVTVANERLLQGVWGLRPDAELVPNGMYVEKHYRPDQVSRVRNRVVFTNADFLKIGAFKQGFLGVLQDFFSEHKDLVLDFYGDFFPELLELPFMHYTNRIRYDDYLRCLSNGDYLFAITPLGGNEDRGNAEFNARKNPFKYLNYGVAGVPGIYSDVPIYQDCISNGHTGVLVPNTVEGWSDAMQRMTRDADLRRVIRENAYKDVAERFHIRKSANRYLKILRALQTRNPGSRWVEE